MGRYDRAIFTDANRLRNCISEKIANEKRGPNKSFDVPGQGILDNAANTLG